MSASERRAECFHGLLYIDSWLEKDGDRCFQLIETDSPQLFERWINEWKDLVSFEVIELEVQKPTQRGLV
ncbi:MAG: DUF3303 domain-containing protein [Chthoniobacterales bacterium]